MSLVLPLAVGCSGEPPCPLPDGMPRLDAVNAAGAANASARALASAWGAESRAQEPFIARLAQAIDQQAPWFPFWEALWVAEPRYAAVASHLSARGLPDALAVLPFALSGYQDSASAPECRTGAWLLSPTATGLRIADCRLRDSATFWSPPGEPEGGLFGEHGCRIQRCDTDERRTFAKATDSALTALEVAWRSTPEVPGKLEERLAAESGLDSALVVAWHVLAVCFYGATDQSEARWRPRPKWCTDAPPVDYAQVARCSTEVQSTP